MNAVDPSLPSGLFHQLSHDLGQTDPQLIEDVFKIERTAISLIQGEEQPPNAEEGLTTGLTLLRKTALYLDEQKHPAFMKAIKKICLFLKRLFLFQFSSLKDPYEKLGDQLIELASLVRYLHKTAISPEFFISNILFDFEQVPPEVRGMVQEKTRAFQELIADIKSTMSQIFEAHNATDGEDWKESAFIIRALYTALFHQAASIETQSNDVYGRLIEDIHGNTVHTRLSHDVFDVSEQSFLATVITHLSLSHHDSYVQRQVEAKGPAIGAEMSVALRTIFQMISEERDPHEKMALLEEAIKKKEHVIEQQITQSCDPVLKDPTLREEVKRKMTAICEDMVNKVMMQEMQLSVDRINHLRDVKSIKNNFICNYPQHVIDLSFKNLNDQIDHEDLFDHFRYYMQKSKKSIDDELAYLLKIGKQIGAMSDETLAELREGTTSVEVFPTIFVHSMSSAHPTIEGEDIKRLLQDALGDGSIENPGFPTLTAVLIHSLIQECQRRKDPRLKALLMKIDSARPSCVNYDEAQFDHLKEFFVCDGSFSMKTFTRNIDLLRVAFLRN